MRPDLIRKININSNIGKYSMRNISQMFTKIISVSSRVVELCDEKGTVFEFEGNQQRHDQHDQNLPNVQDSKKHS